MLARDDTKVKLCLLLPGLAAVGFGIAARLLAGEVESRYTNTDVQHHTRALTTSKGV